MAKTQLNTLSPKKWVANYSGAEPTIDTTDGVSVGDYAYDSSTTPYLQWKCTVNTDSAPVWIETTAVIGDANGNVGIGTAPETGAALKIAGDAGSNFISGYFVHTVAHGGDTVHNALWASSSGANGGHTTVNTAIRASAINGGTNYCFYGSAGGMRVVDLANNATLGADADGDFVAGSSDKRLKDITSNYTGGLDIIRRLNPVNFSWKKNNKMDSQKGKRNKNRININHIGFIAQDVEPLIPEAVGVRDQLGLKDCKTFNSDKLIPALVNAVKEQQIQINNQQETINNLISRLGKLEKKVN